MPPVQNISIKQEKDSSMRPPIKQRKLKKPMVPKLKPPAATDKPKKPREAAVVSHCKKYESQISVKGDRYVLKPLAVTERIDQAKETVFPTMRQLEQFVAELNSRDLRGELNDFRYELHVTEKYVTLRCSKCQLFNYWFASTSGKDISAFCINYEKRSRVVKEGALVNLKLFRKIQQCHEQSKHDISKL